ncbi:helix-turn-helix domain-containing protein [Sporosarcina sp. FA15]|uniref:helix-turn-helix domain-containing protein n=1 Tax=Sporosarcina sp. FA15 TaxID=3413031 RepID=UPI003F6550CD
MKNVANEREATWKSKGAALRKLREDKEISRAEIARQMNISVGRLARLEGGHGVRDANILSKFYELIIKHHELTESVEQNSNIEKRVHYQQKTINTRFNSRNII